MTTTADVQNRSERRRTSLTLVADDDPVSRMLIASKLLEAGGDVMEAEDGAEAILLLEQHSVDLIVTDLEMPRLSGWGVMDWVKNRPEYRDTPVVVLSGSEEARSAALSSGASDFIVKPIEWAAFQRLTRQFLYHCDCIPLSLHMA